MNQVSEKELAKAPGKTPPAAAQTGTPLAMAFVAIALLAVLVAMDGVVLRSQSDAQGLLELAVGLGFAGLLTGALMGAFHYRASRGVMLGTLTGSIVGPLMAPLFYCDEKTFPEIMGIALFGCILLPVLAVLVRGKRRSLTPPASSPWHEEPLVATEVTPSPANPWAEATLDEKPSRR